MVSPELTNPGLPGKLFAELEIAARDQARSVSELLTEAVRKYLDDRAWHRMIESASERTRSLGITENDVPRLIAESRGEQGNER